MELGLKLWSSGGFASPSIRLSAYSITSGAAQDTPIGTLSIAKATGTPTFTLTDDASGKFQLSGAELQAGATPTSSETTIDITVHVTGTTPAIADKVFTINVTPASILDSLDFSQTANSMYIPLAA